MCVLIQWKMLVILTGRIAAALCSIHWAAFLTCWSMWEKRAFSLTRSFGRHRGQSVSCWIRLNRLLSSTLPKGQDCHLCRYAPIVPVLKRWFFLQETQDFLGSLCPAIFFLSNLTFYLFSSQTFWQGRNSLSQHMNCLDTRASSLKYTIISRCSC